MRYVHLTYDPAEETQEQFDIRVDEAIVATGEPQPTSPSSFVKLSTAFRQPLIIAETRDGGHSTEMAARPTCQRAAEDNIAQGADTADGC